MKWLAELFTEPTYLQAVLVICLICAIGTALGKIKFKGVSLGIAFVFFTGIAAGEILFDMELEANWQMVTMIQNFGLILFIYSLGMQVGPGFFPSLKQGGIKLNILGLVCILFTTVAALAFSWMGLVSFPDAMGLLSGAVTNTPMLGAAQQALLDIDPSIDGEISSMAGACAIAYPVGVLGLLLSMILLKSMFGIKSNREAGASDETYVAEFHINNPLVFGKSIKEIGAMSDKHLIISRVWRDGKVSLPLSDTVLQEDDHILAVLKKSDRDTFVKIFGEQDKHDWNKNDIDWDHIDSGSFISKHILVTKQQFNGVKIGDLHLRNLYNINITRVMRAGLQLVASPGLRLQLGDRLTIVGEEQSIRKVADLLGNEEKDLNNPNMMVIFIGIFLGVVLGMLPISIPGMSVPLKLGIAGGPIIVGILMGAFGSRFHIATYTTRSANMMLKQLGLTLYLACLGLSSGAGFMDMILSRQGLLWVAIAFAISTVPVLLTGLVAGKISKLDYAQNAGMICAAMANPIVLSYANSVSDETEASESYATVYPLAMFMRVLSAQIVVILLSL